ncbi:MAG: tRNA uridine-5-carboxymethylaminomethyl(34) synthesis GTPase MnmE [Acidobacteriota bacterium]
MAIATPPGRGGIGVVRLSGPDAHRVARCLIARDRELVPRYATFATVRRQSASGSAEHPGAATGEPDAGERSVAGKPDPPGDAIDQVVITYYPGPASYTGDDVVELSAHGSPVVLRAIVVAAMAAGARLAEPGEFTLRAFVNGRIDLMQAEAIADLIDAVTPLQARAAFDQLQGTLTRTIAGIDAALFDLIARLEASVDFPEEGYHFVDPPALAAAIDTLIERTRLLLADAQRGRLVREGLQVAIVGKPNVGKSSLFNALVGSSRAIVTDRPGTTRDLVTETVDLEGLRVTLVDTAGLRDTSDTVEAEGVERARQAQRVSDLILVVLDGSRSLDAADQEIISQVVDYKQLIVSNKSDFEAVWTRQDVFRASAKTLIGIPELRQAIVQRLDIEPLTDRPEITNVRHIALVQLAHEALLRARAAALGQDGGSLSEEFVLADLQDARAALEAIAGRRADDEVLTHIFSRFCIGK